MTFKELKRDICIELELHCENGAHWVDIKLKPKPVNIDELKKTPKKEN